MDAGVDTACVVEEGVEVDELVSEFSALSEISPNDLDSRAEETGLTRDDVLGTVEVHVSWAIPSVAS